MGLPAPRGRDNSGGRIGKLPEPTAGGDFDPFLNAGVIGKEGARGKITIIGAPEESSGEFSDITIPVKYKGEKYAWGMKFSSGNYARLYKRFGANAKKWKGTVNVEVKHFKKNDYVAVV